MFNIDVTQFLFQGLMEDKYIRDCKSRRLHNLSQTWRRVGGVFFFSFSCVLASVFRSKPVTLFPPPTAVNISQGWVMFSGLLFAQMVLWQTYLTGEPYLFWVNKIWATVCFPIGRPSVPFSLWLQGLQVFRLWIFMFDPACGFLFFYINWYSISTEHQKCQSCTFLKVKRKCFSGALRWVFFTNLDLFYRDCL